MRASPLPESPSMMVWISRGPQNTMPSIPVTIKVHTPPTYLRAQTIGHYINHYTPW